MLALIPFLPFTGFLINATLGRRLTKGVSGAVACLAMLGAFGASLLSAMRLLAIEPGPGRVIEEPLYTWIAAVRSLPRVKERKRARERSRRAA